MRDIDFCFIVWLLYIHCFVLLLGFMKGCGDVGTMFY